MIISQKSIIRLLVKISLFIIFLIALFLSIKTLPPILIAIDPIMGQRGDSIRISGIALSNTDIPTKIFINDTLVPEEDIIHRSFFYIDFKIQAESGAKYVYLKQNNTTSKAKLLIVQSLDDEFMFTQASATIPSKLSFKYRNADNNNFIIDDNIKKIFTHPIEEIQFEVPDTQVIKNTCSSTVISNVMTVELPKHTWNIKDTTTLSLSLSELFWFNYSSVANTYLTFDCKSEQFTFPLTLNSVTVSSEDISSLYELNIIYPKNSGGSYILPIQNRNQQRKTSVNSQYNVFLYNYLTSYFSYPELDISLTITPLIIKNSDSIHFEQNTENILSPAYLHNSNSEKILIDKTFNASIKSTRALINTMRNNPSLQLQDIRILFSTLYKEIQETSDELKRSYITQQYANLEYADSNNIHLLLMARILNRYDITVRTMLGAMIKTSRNQENALVTLPVNTAKELLVWLEFYSKDYGWIAIQNDYRTQANASVSNNDNSLENSIQELRIPKDILRLYVFEEYLWLEQHKQQAILPQQIHFL